MTTAGYIIITLMFFYLSNQIIQLKSENTKIRENAQKFETEVIKTLESVHKCVEAISNSMDDGSAMDEYCTYTSNHLLFQSISLQWIMSSLRPFLLETQQEAADDDDFQTAQELQNIISNLDELINCSITSSKYN